MPGIESDSDIDNDVEEPGESHVEQVEDMSGDEGESDAIARSEGVGDHRNLSNADVNGDRHADESSSGLDGAASSHAEDAAAPSADAPSSVAPTPGATGSGEVSTASGEAAVPVPQSSS